MCALARLLRERTRDADIACRYGGEEFIIVMPGSPLHSAQHRADEIRQQFARSIIEMDGAMLQATISLGLSAYPAHGKNSEDLIKKALRVSQRASEPYNPRFFAACQCDSISSNDN